MNLVAHSQKFFYFGGAMLIVIALLQLLNRSRSSPRRPLRMIDAGVLRILLFVSMGIVAILVGAGVIPLGGAR